jgi:GNAT superfamily N-acetyltransferase
VVLRYRTIRCVSIRLQDGTEMVIRPIRPDDKQRLSDGLRRLSPASAHSRFLTPKPRFTSAELRYLTEVDGDQHFAIVATPADDPDCIAAVARFIRDPSDPRQAEAAITVGDRWQGLGFGKQLGSELARAAAARGVRRFTATMLPSNRPALRLFRFLAEELEDRVGGGVRELVAHLPAEQGAAARAEAAWAELEAAA